MATIARTRVEIRYDKGGPGVNTWYWSAGTALLGDLQTAITQAHTEIAACYSALAAYVPSGVTNVVIGVADAVDVASGEIIGLVIDPDGDRIVAGTGTSSQASRGTQVCVNLYTDKWIRGRRLRGRHFRGPVAGGVVGNDGQISSATQAVFEDAYDAITQGVGPRLAVYSRPNLALSRPGEYGDVVQMRTMDRPANLSSRRDN